MTGSDLIVLAPWILFGVGVSAVVLRLCRSGCSSPRAPAPGQPSSQQNQARPERLPARPGRRRLGRASAKAGHEQRH
jgi:hypothetical protein